MSVVRNLLVRIGADLSGLRNAQREIKNTVRTIGATLAGLGVGLGFKTALDEAIKFEAAMGQINRLLGNNAQEFTKWANESASAFGFARSEAVQFGATYANLLSGFSSGTAETMRRTQDLLKASAVVASSTGRTMEDVMERIRSGLLGNTEAIEDLGLNVNVALIESTKAFQQFANGKSWQQLDFNTQQAIRYFGILEQATTKYGLELANNTASRQAAFVAQLKNTRLALGQAFLPIYNAILPALTRFATALANTMQFIAAFSQALFGSKKAQQQTNTVNAQAGAVSGLGDAYEKAGKQAQKSVAGFDQVNLVGGTSGGSNDATGGGGSMPVPDTGAQEGILSGVGDGMDTVAEKAKAMADRVKAAYGSLTSFIKSNSDIIIASLAAVGAGFATAFAIAKWGSIVATVQKVGAVIAAALGAVSAVVLAIVVAVAALVGAFVYFYRTNEKFRGFVDGILREIGEAAVWLWQNVLVPLGQYIGTGFVAAWNALTVAAEWLWKNVLVPLGNFLVTFYSQAIPVARVLKDVLGVAFKFVSDVAKSFWEKVLLPLGKALTEVFGPAVEAASTVLTFFWKKVTEPLGRFIGNSLIAVFRLLASTITILWQSVLKPVATFVGGVFLGVFNNVFNSIGDIIDGTKTAFIGLMNFITGVFSGNWSMAWNGMKAVFKGVFNSLYGIIKLPLNLIIDAINKVIEGLNSINIDAPDWVPGWAGGGESFGISIPKIPKLAKGGLAFGPTLAMVGDNRGASADPEVIAPLSKLEAMLGKDDNREVVGVLKAILAAVKSSGSGDQATISKTDLARAAATGLNDLTRRSGRNLVIT
ncbi:phage tail protein [Cohnella luojiensis]|uniref:Phage tail tape measure protein n=1 Tax=Cohnella luojiensis TaxID=652876 RepID=A0A4Y8M6V9_9BACL|nr:hypothetical protein [Cohnella luojiensis]TFE30838.1 hypothetical protein E2980_03415 [Cohnella luojiensis]